MEFSQEAPAVSRRRRGHDVDIPWRRSYRIPREKMISARPRYLGPPVLVLRRRAVERPLRLSLAEPLRLELRGPVLRSARRAALDDEAVRAAREGCGLDRGAADVDGPFACFVVVVPEERGPSRRRRGPDSGGDWPRRRVARVVEGAAAATWRVGPVDADYPRRGRRAKRSARQNAQQHAADQDAAPPRPGRRQEPHDLAAALGEAALFGHGSRAAHGRENLLPAAVRRAPELVVVVVEGGHGF